MRGVGGGAIGWPVITARPQYMGRVDFSMLAPTCISLGPATQCDEKGHFAAILRHLEASQTLADHRRPSQVSPPKSQKYLWPGSCPRWNIFILSCDGHRCDAN